MVKLMGHLGMALLWSSPVWFVWEWRESVAFIALALTTAMLPDVDLVLENFLPISHHGITHTVVFVVGTSLLVGALVAYVTRTELGHGWARRYGVSVSGRGLFGFVAGAFALGGLSHIFTDMLSAPDIAEPLEPFWPFVDKPWSLDLIFYSSFWWNVGLLAVALALHLVIAYVTIDLDSRSHIVQRA